MEDDMNTKYTRIGNPSTRIINGDWTTLPQHQGQIVTRSFSGRDSGPGYSAWMRVSDASDGSIKYYRRAK
jgi:hypothetical protein